ncbi:TPA: hypothetical protein ACH3X1_005250 [Trebouxia sp. C0004]
MPLHPGHGGGKRPRSGHEWEEVTPDKESCNELCEDGQDGDGELGQSDAEEGNTAAPSSAQPGKAWRHFKSAAE